MNGLLDRLAIESLETALTGSGDLLELEASKASIAEAAEAFRSMSQVVFYVSAKIEHIKSYRISSLQISMKLI